MFQYVKEMELTTEIRAIRGTDARGGVSIASIHFRRKKFCSLFIQFYNYVPIISTELFQCDVSDIFED